MNRSLYAVALLLLIALPVLSDAGALHAQGGATQPTPSTLRLKQLDLRPPMRDTKGLILSEDSVSITFISKEGSVTTIPRSAVNSIEDIEAADAFKVQLRDGSQIVGSITAA